MLLIGIIAAAGAAVTHILIFVLESLRWTEEPTRQIFGIRSEADAQTTKQLAFNQGFYNLFLALTTILGIVLTYSGHLTVGLTLIFAGTGMMLAASLVLLLSNRRMLRAAVMQGGIPLLAIVALTLTVTLG
ncbi:DUF1304 domain-containing protein [Microbacterium sp. NIBRBAC000506063]|uniref:DUF1304 domain-containing protein n=1 Tax=Microbacterium sp. NIBRBAC000506063 TaxID=2734618 RepID=UPI001BB4ADB0|nr:DUF1304 domain-containing protein [Microbacterium sp. NIBRBAC000506063]QTV79441.1 DUF1304 domain-containing protein [Microbacterium sp. NIBRBAC000506063]